MKRRTSSAHDEQDEPLLEWNVTQCQCGQVVLECGAMSLRMTRLDFARLHRLTAAAMEQFHIEESLAEVGQESDVLLH